ncbi:MAG: DAK2 domain-containing protein, partial [Clostridia bacterium]|nr:DAK2 domain-containing protein [Clostridia bacterium]
VARLAAAKAAQAAQENNYFEFVHAAAIEEAKVALADTVNQNPVLKKAGVVDAGGKGFCVVIEAMKDVFAGGAVVQGEASATVAAAPTQSAAASFEVDIEFPYCTEFIVARDKSVDKDPTALRAYLESIGDSVVVVDDEDIIKVHVHTKDPGKALSAGIKYGAFETVKIENMRIQHENAGWAESPATAQPVVPTRVEPEKDAGFVAVAAGDGLQALFTDLGCDHVVSGGQTMNPSTDDILNAIHATPAKVVYVLPNNKNIILAAEQAVPLADRTVHVLPTRTIPQGVSAMLAYDPDAAVDSNLLNMTRAAENVSTGQVTFAARDSEFGGHTIHKGEILALEGSKVSFVDKDITHAAVKLTKQLAHARKETSFVTLMYGEGITESQAEEVCEGIRRKLGADVEVAAIPGGQPVYYYIISVE